MNQEDLSSLDPNDPESVEKLCKMVPPEKAPEILGYLLVDCLSSFIESKGQLDPVRKVKELLNPAKDN